jgi:cytochrome c-type biogenesis protein CcmE
MKKYGKFAGLIAIVVGTVLWLATANSTETQTYYKTVPELQKMGDTAYGKRLRVGGDVETGSIQRVGNQTQFVLVQETTKLRVAYTGTEPLPDTFKDGAQALADGKLDKDGIFRAAKIQAKCASKYEAKPGNLMKPGQAPNINSGKSI